MVIANTLRRVKAVLRAGESQAQFIAKVIIREVERREQAAERGRK